MRLAESALRLGGKRLVGAAPLASKPQDAPAPAWFRRRHDLSAREVEGRLVLTAGPRADGRRRHIVYLHDGGYVRPLIRPHW
jgi:monoterpene epsilon-lactone hydrolase